MTFFLLLAFGLLTMGAIVGHFLSQDVGYLQIAWGQWVVESTLLMPLILLLVVGLLIWIIWQLVQPLRPHRFGTWRRESLRKRSIQQLERGVQAFFSLNWRQARRMLSSDTKNSPLPWVQQLLLARMDTAEGKFESADVLLQQVAADRPDLDLTTGLVLALSSYEAKEYEQSLAHCRRLQKKYRTNPFVLRLLRDSLKKLEDWRALVQLMPDLAKAPGQGQRRQELFIECMHRLEPVEADVKLVEQAWAGLKAKDREQEQVLAAYLRFLLKAKHHRQALQLIRRRLDDPQFSVLLEDYALHAEPAGKEFQQLEQRWSRAEKLSEAQSMCLARLAQRAELWGKAVHYYGCAIEQGSEVALLEQLRLQQGLNQGVNSEQLQATFKRQLSQLPTLPLPVKPS